MLVRETKALKWLNPADKKAVKKALLKLQREEQGKGKKAGALFKTIHKSFSPGKAGGVTRQRGGTSRGD